jgi:NAD(P)-dependent dehydrogenase (short-subunit alcohol dehydrogenase family)
LCKAPLYAGHCFFSKPALPGTQSHAFPAPKGCIADKQIARPGTSSHSAALSTGVSMAAHDLLHQRTIIVTGAATGIGQAFALGCAAQGAHVVAADMNNANETVDVIERNGGQAIAVKVDVSDDASCQAMAAAALKRFGRIDGLVNNAAYFREVKLTEFENIDAAVWDRTFAVNVKGVWLASKAVLPAMREQGSGSIVNIASVVAVAGQPGYLHYVGSKGAVLAMTKGLAKEVGKHGVRCNVIAPGFVITDATKNRPVEWQQSFLKARALQREQKPDDLVGTALYLLSDLAGFVSGQTIVVDGGHIMY